MFIVSPLPPSLECIHGSVDPCRFTQEIANLGREKTYEESELEGAGQEDFGLVGEHAVDDRRDYISRVQNRK